MLDLYGKKILLLAPKFFGYEQEIKKALNKTGAEVFYYDERPSNGFFVKVIIRLGLKGLIKGNIGKYYADIIEKTNKCQLDYLFIINSETINVEIINKINSLHGNLKVYVYMWDSVKNKKQAINLLSVSDKYYTFDPEDKKIDKRIRFLPLFYIDNYEKIGEKENNEYQYDLSFIGTIHSDRYRLIKQIEKAMENKLRIKFFFYSPSKLLFLLKKIFDWNFWSIDAKIVSFNPLNSDSVLSIISNSKIIIDIEHPSQKGLTMRTIEMLGAKKKIITTNNNIKNYDFYHENNILMIDRNNIKISNNFLYSEFHNIPDEIYSKYSLQSWIKNIFCE